MGVDARDPELGFQSWLFRPALNPNGTHNISLILPVQILGELRLRAKLAGEGIVPEGLEFLGGCNGDSIDGVLRFSNGTIDVSHRDDDMNT